MVSYKSVSTEWNGPVSKGGHVRSEPCFQFPWRLRWIGGNGRSKMVLRRLGRLTVEAPRIGREENDKGGRGHRETVFGGSNRSYFAVLAS